jgi:hypothetical protein
MNRRQRRAQAKADRIATATVNKRIHLSVHDRKCGDCTACCTVMSIEAVESPCGEACKHLTDSGCGIYRRRPQSCQDWNCVWKMGGLLRKSERPDKTGLVIDVTRNTPDSPVPRALVFRQVWDGAFEESKYVLDRLVEEGHLLYLLDGDKRRVLGPPEKVAQVEALAAGVSKE